MSTCMQRGRHSCSKKANATSVMAGGVWKMPFRLPNGRSRTTRSWTRDRILSAMTGTQTFSVRLERPIQVLLFYTPAAVVPEDGTIHFAEDIYGHDVTLDKALVRRGPETDWGAWKGTGYGKQLSVADRRPASQRREATAWLGARH